jgi:hypothetical protein
MRRGIAAAAAWIVSLVSFAAGAAPVTTPPPVPDEPASYDDQSMAALAVGASELEGLAWAATAACADGDELARRQCRVVRDARLERGRAAVLRVTGDRGALEIGAWDAAGQGLPIIVRGCVACVATVDVGGSARHLAAVDGALVVEGGVLRGAVVHRSTRLFSSEAAAERWQVEVAPRLVTELLVRLPPASAPRPAGDAVAIEVVGFRVHDPCSGAVVASSAQADPVRADPGRCGKAPEKPVRTAVPDQLSTADIREALAPAEVAARACFERYGVAGAAQFRISIADTGAVLAVTQAGDFVDTPTGACIEVGVKAARFPRTRRARSSITYPIVVR